MNTSKKKLAKASQKSFSLKKSRKPNFIQDFFITCSGANKDILSKCPTEWNKYSGIGATIFLTSCLAMLSGGYAFNFVFENTWISILFGVFWGIVIFNLDRYITLSLRKERIPTVADILSTEDLNKKEELKYERRRLLWSQGLMALPRFIIAIIIAITISKPLELHLFKDRINKEIEKTIKNAYEKFDQDEKDKIESLKDQLTKINRDKEKFQIETFSKNPLYQEAQKNISNIEKRLQAIHEKINDNNDIIRKNYILKPIFNYDDDGNRVPPFSKSVPNEIAIAKIKENAYLRAEQSELTTELSWEKEKKHNLEKDLSISVKSTSEKYESLKSSIQQQINQLNDTYLKRKSDWIAANKKSKDLPSRLEALGNIASFGNSIWWASLLITLLFIALETAPVVLKLLTRRGPYDEILDRIEYEHFLEQSELISRWNAKINNLLEKAMEAAKLEGEIYLKIERQKLEYEIRNNKRLLEYLSEKQEHLVKIAIDKWYQNELDKATKGKKEILNATDA